MGSWQGIRHVTVPDRLAELVDERPDATFAVMGDWSASYAEIDVRASEIAGQFAALGVTPGDRVATLTPNRYQLLELMLGLAKLGAIQVPLNPFLRGEFLRYQLADCGPNVVITDERGWDAVRRLAANVPNLTHVVLLDPGGEIEESSLPVLDYGSLPSGTAPQVDLTAASTMSIVYTSGTTGLPKGCVLSHGYYTRCGQIDAELEGLDDDDIFFTTLPLFHAGAQLKAIMPSMMAGIPIVIEPEFSASRFFQRIAETGATVASGIGSMGSMLLGTPVGAYEKNHRLRLINISPLAEHLQIPFEERFHTSVWTESYGQTECVPSLSNKPTGPRDRASNGRPVRDLEVALLDEECQPVRDGEPGEICLRPHHLYAMCDGYWGRPDATVEAFRGLWYHTGDFGVMRPSGAIQFVDRKKDALRVRGENVSSIELETAIGTHPAVAESAVHAIPSDVGEDDIKVAIVLSAGAAIEPEPFFEWLRQNLPYFAVPRYVEIMDALPKNHTLRVQKHLLRERGITPQTWDFKKMDLTIAKTDRR